MLKARQIENLTHGLAAALLSGPWEADPMMARLADALGRRWRWRRSLVREILQQHSSPPPYDTLCRTIQENRFFHDAVSNRTRPHIAHRYLWPPAMAPAFPEWEVPTISTVGELGTRLGLSPTQLTWLADCEHRQARTGDATRRHYRYHWIPKSSGGRRLVEQPLPLLKAAQRTLLHDVLDCVPPHPAACAFQKSRSIVDYAAAHTGRETVLHVDLRDFFTSIPASRVHALFKTLGYPNAVARIMTGLCTSTVPLHICRQHPGGQVYSAPHLPQGAPTSPALANLAAYRLDCRLSAAAAAAGAAYTRYADDFAFSGDAQFTRSTDRFLTMLWRIVADEGFTMHHRKTRRMHKSVRQRLCGLIVNDRLNVDRRSYDRLKAILTNCVRHGLESQNRNHHPDFRAHLRGRIAYVAQINSSRGARLQTIFDRIS